MYKVLYCFLILFLGINHVAAANFKFDYEHFNYLESDNGSLKLIKKLLEDGKSEEALEKLYKYIEEVKITKENKKVIEAKILLADIYRENGDYKKSTSIFNEVIPLISDDFRNLEYVFFKKGGNFQRDSQIDSAKVFYEKAVEVGEKVVDNEDLKAKLYSNLSGIFYLKGDYDSAIKYFKIAANFQKILGNKDIEAGILNNIGSVYYMQGKYTNALETFQKAFDLVGFGQEDLQKQTRNKSYINMAYAYSELKDYKKAFEYQDKYFSLNDSLQKELKYKEIAVIQSEYNLEKKEKEKEIEKAKRKDAEYLTFGLSIAVIILLLGVYFLYKLYKLNKRNHVLQINQEQLLSQNKIEKIKTDNQSKILAATLDGRLEERKKIANVLHDNVSALLSATNLHLYASKKKLKENVPTEIEKAQQILDEASEQIRDLSHNLISSVLVKFGLSVAVQDLCEKSSNSSISLICISKDIGRFSENFEIKMFNIINECVNNILKHSKAKKGIISLEQLDANLIINVSDNGVGFDAKGISGKGGIGLNQVKARIKVLYGTIEVNSSKEGTQIFISVPIEN